MGLEELLAESLGGVIECPTCGLAIEGDADKCPDGHKNPLLQMGLI